MTAVRIIGVGSPQAADSAGWIAIEALERQGLAAQYPAGMLSLRQCRAPVHLYQALAGSQCGIIVDALAGTETEVLRLTPEQLQARTDLASVHGIGVGEALALIQALGSGPAALTVLGIGIDVQAVPELVEQRVKELLPDLSQCIARIIAEYVAAAEQT